MYVRFVLPPFLFSNFFYNTLFITYLYFIFFHFLSFSLINIIYYFSSHYKHTFYFFYSSVISHFFYLYLHFLSYDLFISHIISIIFFLFPLLPIPSNMGWTFIYFFLFSFHVLLELL